ncbi:hypothetical protein [Sphingopyxis solisilvae]|uniref:hypothetical protein n=1 Tax=Sphingopyxis solisilvae TaxID=1886788 RepID=UPI001892AA95|nr:hypothetical protein [Sphingopyxis solisilvae]
MQFVEAFEHLGYHVEAPRQDWSAENDDGVCISLWKKEVGTRDGLMWMNTVVHADPIENWGTKSGNTKRIRHLRRALEEFGGRVDVVIVSGEPGESYGTAQPWVAKDGRADTYWEITEFDGDTGHFEVVLVRQVRTAPTSQD